jgi:uncharacterized protein
VTAGSAGESPADDSAPAVRETHISTLFFAGDRVYKAKKPVRFDFLDFSTRERRRRACEREVELNRRLAPDVYLGVAELRDVDGAGGEPLVAMRRMPEARRLATLVRGGDDVDGCIRETARIVAAFHTRAETSDAITAAGSPGVVRANWESNFVTMQPFVGSVLDPGVASDVEQLARRYLDGRTALFAARQAHGKVKDGHGDLLADDVFCLDDGPRILDCIEFDDQLRYGDVLADVAFLAMDLERVGDPELGQRFLAWYRDFAGETYPESLAHHYVAYRAHVRAKVGCLRAGQGDPAAASDAATLLGLARDHLRRGRVALVLVGGLPGTGKSTVADGLADGTGWTVLRSDELRKDLAGIGHTTRRGEEYGAGLYDDASTRATYGTLLDRARALLEAGEPVILDASWTREEWRDAARAVAQETHSDVFELRCDVDPAVAADRLEARARTGADPSDATPAIAASMAGVADPWPASTRIDTAAPVDEATLAACRALR